MRYLLGLFLTFMVVFVVTFVVNGVIASPALDATDNQATGARSGLWLSTDYGTGCQYLHSPKGGLMPRLDKAGKHMCGEAK